MFSRALWIGSHVAALRIRLDHPDLPWTAEFSDPLRLDADGRPRRGDLPPTPLTDRLFAACRDAGLDTGPVRTLFDLVELATIALADSLVFTNDNQLAVVTSGHPEGTEAQKLLGEKATVSPQPAPPAAFYGPAPDRDPDGPIVIGYFGRFYPTRGPGDVLTSLADLPHTQREGLELRIHCPNPEDLAAEAARLGIGDHVTPAPYLPYREFLEAARACDVLLATDATTPPGLAVNPFLPSKYADYAGSGVPVWGIVEDGSPLSAQDLDFRSALGDPESIRDALRTMTEWPAPQRQS